MRRRRTGRRRREEAPEEEEDPEEEEEEEEKEKEKEKEEGNEKEKGRKKEREKLDGPGCRHSHDVWRVTEYDRGGGAGEEKEGASHCHLHLFRKLGRASRAAPPPRGRNL